ncbi:MAG: polyprenyl synthetase family protein [Planctomycetes bacterium]|nr:polyprenyl synthetase family protein [Planctomycetota bacterium]
MSELEARLAALRERVEAALGEWLPLPADDPGQLFAATRYSALEGGKRLRPALCLLGAEAVGGDVARALPAACALEMIHVYSLVHDDLPAMDDDDLRRGRPTCHKAYSEWLAILVGDGLQTRAFETLALAYADDPPLGLDLVRLLAEASGNLGMVGGQVRDMAAMGRDLDEAALEAVHREKTGALLRAAVLLGARIGGAQASDARFHALDRYARALGLAFQVADDILDCTASTAELGKTAGKDAEQGKLTYVSLLGLEGARSKAKALEATALAALSELGPAAEPLRQLASYVVDRGA